MLKGIQRSRRLVQELKCWHANNYYDAAGVINILLCEKKEVEIVMRKFEDVIQSSREEDVQSYLSDNQNILLAAFGDGWAVNECIPKFRFGNEYVSDFVIVTGQSFSYDITLVELEPPTEQPFTKAGKFAKRLNDAIGQVNDWFAWIHENEDYFRKSLSKAMKNSYGARQIEKPHRNERLGFPDENRHRNFVSAKIVIGRREMLTEEDNKRRATIYSQTHKGIEILHFDRLIKLEDRINNVGANRNNT